MLIAKFNFHSFLELFVFFHKFHLTYASRGLGLGFRLLSAGEGKRIAVEEPSRSCVAVPGMGGLTDTLLAGLPSPSFCELKAVIFWNLVSSRRYVWLGTSTGPCLCELKL